MPPAPDSARAIRTTALDSLRGWAVFGMMFAGVIPWDGLPGWMYHAQERPPTHDFNPNLPGLSWVDLVFPFFLFSMGAAIPLASRSAEGLAWHAPYVQAVRRGLMLVAFAVFNQHARPYILAASPDTKIWLIGLIGFVIPFLIFVRFPRSVPNYVQWMVRGVGYVGAVIFLTLARYPDGSGFRLDRADPIILVLAATSTFGTVLWLTTRDRWDIRLGVMAAWVALRIGALSPNSSGADIWNWGTPYGLFQTSFLGYLLMTIPGTMLGDLLVKSRSESTSGSSNKSWEQGALAVLGLATIPVALVILYSRTVSPGLILLPTLGCVGLVTWRPASFTSIVRQVVGWGAFWLMVGFLMEPFQGGIKKDPPTLSYGFVTAGLPCFFFVSLHYWQLWRPRSGLLRFSALTGMNPLLAYQALTNLIAPIWALTIAPWIIDLTPGTGFGLVRALLQTIFLGAVVAACTRSKIVMRA